MIACPSMDSTVVQRLREAGERLFRGGPLLAAYVYGSQVSGRPRPASDVDIGYYASGYRGELLPLREELRLASALSDAVGLEVDLRNLADAPLELRGRVLQEGVRIYSGNDARRVELERRPPGALPRLQGSVPAHARTAPGRARRTRDVTVVDKPKLDQMLSNLRQISGCCAALRPRRAMSSSATRTRSGTPSITS